MMNDSESWMAVAVADDLKHSDSRFGEANYRLWRRSSLNMYRGIVAVDKKNSWSNVGDLRIEVQEIVSREFRPKWNWLRGFAFGTCLTAPAFPRDAECLPECIDIYNRFGGVWQWLVYVAREQRLACAIHTWSEGYLSPTLRRLVGAIEESGIPCPTFVRDKGPIFGFAAAIGRQPLSDFEPRT
jgi:hypothetical protein